MIINHNMNAMNAHRMMMGNTQASGKSMEKLSSGLRINRAGDDAAGLAISEKMRGQIRGLDQASRNSQDGISMLQTAEGALNETHSILQRMRELAVQAGNDTNVGDDRDEIQNEMNQLIEEIDRIGNNTEFNTQKLLDGGAAQAASGSGTTDAAAASFEVAGTTLSDATFQYATNSATAFDVVDSAGGAGVTIDLDTDYADLDAVIADVQSQLDAATTGGSINGTYTVAANDAGDGFVITADETYTIANSTESGITDGASTEVAAEETTTTTEGFNATFQVGANSGQTFSISIDDMRAEALGLSSGSGTTDAAAASFEVAGTTLSDATFQYATNSATAFDVVDSAGGAGVTIDLDTDYADLDAVIADVQSQLDAATTGGSINGTYTVAANDAGDGFVITADETYTIANSTESGITDGASTEVAAEETTTTTGIDVSTSANANTAIETIDNAIKLVSQQRSKLGAYQNRLEHTIANLGTSSENLTSAESRIRDVDMAKEMMQFSKNNILSQAAQAMISQANQQPQGVLQLLR